MRKFTLYIIFASIFTAAPAQTVSIDRISAVADSLRNGYEFAASAAVCRKALDHSTDSLSTADSLLEEIIRTRLALAENGEKMSGFVCEPLVVARKRFHKDDFFLYYPIETESWMAAPNSLDTTGRDTFAEAVYFPEDSRDIYYSAPAEDGIRNIYRTVWEDSLWSVPALINESLTTAGDEIYPMLSPDGKTMFFASSGLYGVGGYDLYYSQWDETAASWGAPLNMGFPFSSPANDFLFACTYDGQYSVFASDRDCPKDSVCVYVLQYDNVPVRKEIRDTDALKALMRLEPPAKETVTEKSSNIPENIDTEKYMRQMSLVRELKDSVEIYGRLLDSRRSRFAESDDTEERERLTTEILRGEAQLPVLQKSLEQASETLQMIELEFLYNGVIIDPDKMLSEADKVPAHPQTEFEFRKKELRQTEEMIIRKPKPVFDYSFMVLPVGRFAEDNTLPDGIVYQIQILSVFSPISEKQLKGLSPVFARKTDSGRYVYSVGVFRTYNDVLSKLNTVKRAGFKTAYITAWSDGRPVSISQARNMEN